MPSKHHVALAWACLAFSAATQAQSERIFLDDFDHPIAMRISDMDLRDPHVFVNFFSCTDVTDTAIAGFSLNGQWQTQIQTDADGDGLLDRSDVLLFEPLDTTEGAPGALDWMGSDCTAPMTGTACSANGGTPLLTTYTTHTSGTCLATLTGTVRPYGLPVAASMAPCFVTPGNDILVEVLGASVVLRDARIAATWTGAPPSALNAGLLRGFLSETDANNTLLPDDVPFVGGQPLSVLLPGGDPPGAGNTNCAGFSDLDLNGGVTGWWFYFNFQADRVPFAP